MKASLAERTPIVEECKTAGQETIPDPTDTEKNSQKRKKIDRRVPCKRIEEDLCTTVLCPALKWRDGKSCPFAIGLMMEEAAKIKVNPLKASKRAAGK
jgi:hypothetical protein